MTKSDLLHCISTLDDNRFDSIYPREIRQSSAIHWTPVGVARQAAEFLVQKSGTRVLDVGCGPGKFCLVGALVTTGEFTGVEQRGNLCAVAREKIEQANISNAGIIHGNITQLSFAEFDAFYIFNPFQENLGTTARIDSSMDLDPALYEKYIQYVARQLALAPLGTRVVTYCGECQEVPMSYECLNSSSRSRLKRWEKTKEFPVTN